MICFFRNVRPDHFLLILHENSDDRFSLIPGENLGKGSAIEKIKLGEMMNIGVEKQKKIRNVKYHNDNCIFYEKNDSQARCSLEKILVPRFRDVNQHINECARNDMNVTRLCIIPQIYDIYDFMEANFSLPQCQTEDEYICSIIGKCFTQLTY